MKCHAKNFDGRFVIVSSISFVKTRHCSPNYCIQNIIWSQREVNDRRNRKNHIENPTYNFGNRYTLTKSVTIDYQTYLDFNSCLRIGKNAFYIWKKTFISDPKTLFIPIIGCHWHIFAKSPST